MVSLGEAQLFRVFCWSVDHQFASGLLVAALYFISVIVSSISSVEN